MSVFLHLRSGEIKYNLNLLEKYCNTGKYSRSSYLYWNSSADLQIKIQVSSPQVQFPEETQNNIFFVKL